MAKISPPADDGDVATGSNAPQVAERSLERALGIQIRQLRRQNDLSVSDLASAAGISNGMLSKIENGGISASLSTLQGIAGALNVPISSLFASFEERQDCSYVAAGQGLTMERRGTKAGHVYELLGHVLRGDTVVEPYMITLRENAIPHTSFRHGGVEFIHMIDGEIVYRHGGEQYTLRNGDSLLFDSNALHGPEALVSPTSRYLSIIIYPRGEG
ncbi:helix-turn-helix domain-containing protein [Rhizorhabdus dicambivorans]|uniref:XRE family transcriptional regulator n=1 Tax=Rhizorhabdus dicambivorans TaxID=1850238 RepID=A0A2A4FT16_9SPHN|nr:XRE family transcriptional regulator [Rhizorhabdus dicambivorans]ATE65542.1 XRE family transcriptional regulator [Rhizorhabdus dicambivorans]PCE41885.1 XRE family transcriptional regulator [Rhizorhabdus dicambivorans]